MNMNEIIQIVLFFGIGIALTVPLGKFMYRVYTGERTFLHPILLPVEKLAYKLTGVDPNVEMSWVKLFVGRRAADHRRVRLADGDFDDAAMAAVPQSAGPSRIARGIWPSTPPGVSYATPIGNPTAAKPP